MMRFLTAARGRFRSAALSAAAVFAVITFAGSAPRAQTAPSAGPQARVVRLQQGRPFHGDLRQLPDRLPPQREHRPVENEREEPSLSRGGGDPAAQTSAPAAPAPAPGTGSGAGNFAGLDFAHWGDGWPPDPNGDVGPIYYIQTVNTSVGVFRKSDGIQVAAFSFDTLMGQGNLGNACDNQNFGDPVVVWDAGADRWIISNFAFATNAGNPVAPYFECFAVSRTGDPVNGGWNFYALQTTDLFPDYPKLGVWPDGLYLTANMFSANTFKNVRVWALDKTQMYAGVAASAVTFNLPSKVQGVSVFTGIPSTYHTATGTPPAGRPNFISVIWSSKIARIWKFHVDWSNTANSTLTGPSNVTLASWGVGPSSVPAKSGNALDTLRERLMVQNQYTNLAGAESLWLTHTVANPGNVALTSPRWYQLAVTGGTVVTSGPLQQSTWAPDSTVARWMPSLAVDKDGNMAIGYSVASSTLFPGIRYAGRLATDPANTLGQTETSLIEGTASQCCNFSDGTVNNRWGDYSAMTIDPDGCTFWYTTEYYQSPQPASLAADNWQTRIGSFKFAGCTPNASALQGSATSSATGNPIAGATVTIGTSSTTTDAGGQYTIGSLTPGTYNATASAPGYTGATVSVTILAGVTTTQNFALVPAAGTSTSLAVAAASGTFGGTTTLSATLTAGGTGVTGKSINFTLNGNSAGSASTDASGVAMLSNVSLAGVGAGTYASGVGASFAGDGSYASSSGTNSLTVAKASQTISFGALASKTYGDPSFSVSATASSGLVVSFSASGNCAIATTTVTITGAGSCTITASQAGGANYLAAPNVPQTFTIAKASQVITFNPLPDKTTSDPPFTVSATASSGLAVSFSATGNCTVSGNTVTITGSGTCTITALQAGNVNYNPAPDVPRTFNITSGGGSGPSAAFVGIDSSTQGSWSTVYGADGYNVVNDLATYPAYAVVAPSGQGSYTWLTSTSDVRALQKASNPADRLAATWYGSTFSIDLNLTDGNTHQVGFYVVDWDSTSRTETLEVHDAATNALLDSRIVSGFHDGRYVIWNLRGHVTVRVVSNAGVNAVVSGLFFGGSAPPPNPTASAAFVGTDAATQGSWKGVYGSDGYNVVNDAISYPAYAQVAPAGQSSYTWAATTTDVRALQKANTADRLAATWYGLTFTIDLNLVDGLTHRVALYVVDWDSTSRIQIIEVRDSVTNALLDTRTVSGFHDGQYLAWNIRGHVTVRVVNTAGVNAVLSGLFFGS